MSVTVALNSPLANAGISDTTPVLDFTGTDPESDSIEYQVQVDTAHTFAGQAGATIDSYGESNHVSNYSSVQRDASGFDSYGQAITGTGEIIGVAKFWLRYAIAGTGNIVAKIYAISGTFGTNSIPTGAALATSDLVDFAGVGSSFSLVSFNFSGANQITLTDGTNYFLTVEDSSLSTNALLRVGVDGSSPTHAGNSAYRDGGVWTGSNGSDTIFYLLKPSVPLLDKVSETDAGFANPDTPGDTHPFNSGENIQYTVQSALALGLYYWRVRGIDPLGANVYGAWSSIQTFTIAPSIAGIQSIAGVGSITF